MDFFFFFFNFFKQIFQEYHQSVKQFGSRSGLTFCRAWSGSKLFAKVISRWQKSPLAGKELTFYFDSLQVKCLVEFLSLKKVPITTAADIFKYFLCIFLFAFNVCFLFRENKTWQMIHMKCQALFSLKNKSKFTIMSSATVLLGTFRILKAIIGCPISLVSRLYLFCHFLFSFQRYTI